MTNEATCGGSRFVWCAWCHAFNPGEHDTEAMHNEAVWLVEVVSPDAEIRQRLGACDDHAEELFDAMRDEPARSQSGNYSVLRRWLPSDIVLHMDELAEPGLSA